MDGAKIQMTQKLYLLVFILAACTTPGPTPAPSATALPPTVTQTLLPTAEPPTPTFTPPPTAIPSPTTAVITAPDSACCALAPIINDLTRPVLVTNAGDERLFTVEQRGLISVFANDTRQPFLDLQTIVGDEGNEQGLLGLAFHPDYANNGLFFVNYTDNNGNTVIAQYQVAPTDPNQADPQSARTLFTVAQPYPNHNGGGLAFGPDGLLYIGLGDGGSAGDPRGNGQNPAALLGKMLRLNVDDPKAQPEIWALGLRNPWRFSFDRETGDLFLGDVGQNKWEEIDYVPAPMPTVGPNFGWNILEGLERYSGFGDPAGLTSPIAEYSLNEGRCSVVGGYVYRGAALPSLRGNYFFGDYCAGTIWALTPNPQGLWDRSVFMQSDLTISSFGEDVNGELYVVNHGGVIYQLVGE